jgi:hypothetical protein
VAWCTSGQLRNLFVSILLFSEAAGSQRERARRYSTYDGSGSCLRGPCCLQLMIRFLRVMEFSCIMIFRTKHALHLMAHRIQLWSHLLCYLVISHRALALFPGNPTLATIHIMRQTPFSSSLFHLTQSLAK